MLYGVWIEPFGLIKHALLWPSQNRNDIRPPPGFWTIT